MCRIMVSTKKCTPSSPAELPQELYLIGLLSLQIVENIDLLGLYGNLFDLLKFLKALKSNPEEEIPPFLLSTYEFEELPLLPEERALRKWVGELYRKKVLEDLTFRELLDKVKERSREEESLSFLKEIFTT